MLVCVPTEGNQGMEATVSGHFGSAPCFTLYNTDTEEVAVIDNRNAHHDHGTCHPMNQLGRYHVDCIVCGGMGRRAIEALNSEGIKIYKAAGGTVRETIEVLKTDGLAEIDPAKACRGHGQQARNGCAHGSFDSTDLRGGSGRGSGYGQGGGGRGN